MEFNIEFVYVYPYEVEIEKTQFPKESEIELEAILYVEKHLEEYFTEVLILEFEIVKFVDNLDKWQREYTIVLYGYANKKEYVETEEDKLAKEADWYHEELKLKGD